MEFPASLARELALLSDHLTAAAARDVESATAAAAAQHGAQVSSLRTEVAGLTDEIAALKGQLADGDAERERLRAKADELSAANRTLALELADRVAEREAAEATAAALQAERERASNLQRERDELADAAARATEAQERQTALLEASRAAAQEAIDAHAREAAAHQTAERELLQLREAVTTVRDALQEAEATRDREATRAAGLEQEVTDLRRVAGSTHATVREALADRLASVFDDISRAASVDEVLGAAADGLAEEFARVAVLGANGGRLEPRYQRGFDPAGGVERTVADLDDGTFLARAARSAELGVHANDALTDLPFGGEPSVAVTAPISVRGELLALVYADNDGRPHPSDATSLRLADIIRRHASLRLDRLTLDLKTIDELRAYARMLLDEVEYVYRADVSARKPEGERLERLTENLRCARQIYQQRLAIEGPTLPSMLEEVVAAAIATKASTPFGRELAAVAAHAYPLEAAVGA